MKDFNTKMGECERMLHHNMAMVGGFLGCYAIMLRSDFFGNSMTANLIFFVMALLGNNLIEVGVRFIAVVLYFAGGFLFVYFKEKHPQLLQPTALFIDAVAILILGFLPEDINPIVALYPVFFSMSFQWNCFPGAYGYASSPIFSTNNTRQASISFAEFIFTKDRMQLHKMLFFLGSLLFFHIGVACAYMLVNAFGIRAAWFCWIFVFSGLLLYFRKEKVRNGQTDKAFA